MNNKANPWEKVRSLAMKLSKTPVAIYPSFAAIDRPNPTVSWLPKAPVTQKDILLGDDCFMQLLKWKNAKVLIRHIHKIFVITRVHDKNEITKNFAAILEINPLVEMELLPDHPYKNISSTILRKRKPLNTSRES